MRALKFLVSGVLLWSSVGFAATIPLHRSNSPSSQISERDLDSIYPSHLQDERAALEKRGNSLFDLGKTAAAAVAATAGIIDNLIGDPAKLGKQLAGLINLLQQLTDNTAKTIGDLAKAIAMSGLIPADIVKILRNYAIDPINSSNNKNPAPGAKIFPKKDAGDAPYSVGNKGTREKLLRSAIYMPREFKQCRHKKPAILFVPGTAVPAGTTFFIAFRKQFAKSGLTNRAVWLNIPGTSLDDAQVTSEYVAYAINYLSALCGNKKITVLSWSQGGINTQWALKYWPSTRRAVEDFVAVAPPFRGTTLAHIACPPRVSLNTCVAAFKQQASGSNFVKTLGEKDGLKAYVPTTTIYTNTDEVVQPMKGRGASAFIETRPGINVANIEIQNVCKGRTAGGLYTHEVLLVNPLTWAVFEDAIKHAGPAMAKRIEKKVCNKMFAPGVGFDEALGAQGFLTISAETMKKAKKVTKEPVIKSYAV